MKMKVTTFRIKNPKFEALGNPVYGARKAIYDVPTLPAYAIIDSRLEMIDWVHNDIGYSPPRYELLENTVSTPATLTHDFGDSSGILTIYHNGIKDYELLFPHVEMSSLRTRLGQFAEEADKAFESQSWISYCLMVGSVVEGLLYNQLGDKNFFNLITAAHEGGIITDEEFTLMDNIRKTRNKIHAGKHEESIANRTTALELSTVYDKFIKRNW